MVLAHADLVKHTPFLIVAKGDRIRNKKRESIDLLLPL